MYYNITTVLFIWDAKKAGSNLKKHKVSFELATTIFDDHLHLSVLDGKARGEERWLQSAWRQTNELWWWFILISEDDDVVRLISARVATRKEKQEYEEGV